MSTVRIDLSRQKRRRVDIVPGFSTEDSVDDAEAAFSRIWSDAGLAYDAHLLAALNANAALADHQFVVASLMSLEGGGSDSNVVVIVVLIVVAVLIIGGIVLACIVTRRRRAAKGAAPPV